MSNSDIISQELNERVRLLSSSTGKQDSYYQDTSYDDRETEGAGLLDFWRIIMVIRRWWWAIALIVTLITAITAVILFRITPIYKATTLLEVKQEERNIVDVSAVESVIADNEFLTTQIELLQSESLIQETIESLNLLSDPYLVDLDDETWALMPRERRLRALTKRFKRNLKVRPVGRSRLMELSFEHSDSSKSAQIANTMVETYLANGLTRKFEATAFARDFLRERLTTVRASLELAERSLVDYATENNLITANNENTRNNSSSLDMDSLQVLNSELTAASIARVEAQVAYEQSLQSQENTSRTALVGNESVEKLQSRLIELRAEYTNQLAFFKPQYPAMKELNDRIELFEKEIDLRSNEVTLAAQAELKMTFDRALAKEEDLIRRVSGLKGSVVDLREKSVDYNILKRQVETERTQYEALLQRLKEVSVADNLGSNLVEVVDQAQIPNQPFKPNRFQGIALALLLSSIFGFGAAYTLEGLDDHVKGPEDVKVKLGQVVMGVIPVSEIPEDFTLELADPRSSVAEAYASLRTNLQFSGSDGGPRVIQVTSTRSGEGKSVSSFATALRFAGVGKKVLLIDADMRLPTFSDMGGKSIGLSGVLTSLSDIAQEIIKTQHENLYLLPSGPIPPNPSEILAQDRFDQIIAYAREHFDYIMVDSPPVLGLADALILGAKVDATLLVVEAGQLRTPNVKTTIERLKGSGTKVLGVILTKYTATSQGYMDYYQYAYGDADKAYKAKSNKKKTKKIPKSKLNIT